MPRFFIDALLTDSVVIRGQDAHHISRVLRLPVGADIVIADRNGQAFQAKIAAMSQGEVTVAVGNPIDQRREPPVEVWLAQGLPKGDKMDYIIQKAVEIGAAGVIPMAIDFSTVKYDQTKKTAKVGRWQKIAEEAAKQCGRDRIPVVAPVQSLGEILAQRMPETATVMLYEGKTGAGLKQTLAGCHSQSILLLIGSEGGFSPAEVALCQDKGVQVATMGPRILRTETAAVAALAVVMYEKGDLGG
ncbi:MAG: 16S rRNA (uracil(1498)-N(3))-methyltransferase [Negativicutes bacterium]|nr:16S rRNA (uracil(1498)-N(3))-methyltransferase [Negativicutes bacterium]